MVSCPADMVGAALQIKASPHGPQPVIELVFADFMFLTPLANSETACFLFLYVS
jgi:hypothetical protein